MPTILSTLAVLVLMAIGPVEAAAPPHWQLTGDLSESCTCPPPCTCNFGQGSSPHSYCWALYSLDILKGSYGDVRLDGLHLTGALGAKGSVYYIDDTAPPQQAAALKAIAKDIDRGENPASKAANSKKVVKSSALPTDSPTLLAVRTAHIEQIATKKGRRLRIGNAGGFDSDYILGIDGKTPVVVENNWSWNIQHGMKGKTHRLYYHDSFGNQVDLKGTNSNQGQFDWSDTTPIYFR